MRQLPRLRRRRTEMEQGSQKPQWPLQARCLPGVLTPIPTGDTGSLPPGEPDMGFGLDCCEQVGAFALGGELEAGF